VVLVTDIPGQPVGPILRVPESKRIGFLSSWGWGCPEMSVKIQKDWVLDPWGWDR
jgi:hypothetical protein